MLTAVNPANGNIIRTYEEHSTAEVADKVNAAHQAFLTWRETTFPQRVEKLRKAARVLIDKKEAFAALMANEMGKPIRDGRAEIEKCAWACEYYADTATASAVGAHRDRCPQKLYIVYPSGGHPGHHAVELSFLAGIPVCGPGPDGRQCRGSQACLQCAGLRPGD